METISPMRWTDTHKDLWQRLCAHPFEQAEQGMDLSRRLAKEQGLSPAKARGAIDEYRRFCFLACVVGHEVTPSELVDQVWHLHLIHTRDYWQQFCPQVLRTPLHHGPTRGGVLEARRYREQYAQTLAHYEAYFGPPPADYWPGTQARFAKSPVLRRVDPAAYWLLPKPRWSASVPVPLLLLGLLCSRPALALSGNPLDWTAGPFLQLFLLLMVLGLALSIGLRRMLRNHGAARGERPNPFDLAYLAGGSARCTDAAVAQLLADEAVRWDPGSKSLKLKGSPLRQSPPLDAVMTCIAASGTPEEALKRTAVALKPVQKSLETRGLWLDDAGAWRVRLVSALPLAVVAIFGVAKIMVGISRAKPVGFLVILTIVSSIAALLYLLIRPTRTRAGDQALAEAKQKHARAIRAPRNTEVGIAVALMGTAALSGTAYAEYHQARQPPSSSSDGGGGGGDSGGDSGGGGGCGGCGGGGD